MLLDQSNSSGTAGNPEVTNADTVWQSFTCGIEGELAQVKVYRDSFSSSGDIVANLAIYSGTGIGGTVLSTQTVTITAGGGLKTFTLVTAPTLTIGNVYTLALSGAAASWYVRTGYQSPDGPYSGGKAGHTGTSFGDVYDLYFETYIEETITYITITDTATGTDSPIADTGAVTNRYVSDAGLATEAIYAPIWTVTDTGGVDPELGEVIVAPIFPITDTATGTDLISRPMFDTGTGADTIAVAVSLPTVSDTATGNETIIVTGNTPTPPAAAATGGLDGKPVLRLLYGNDKRNPDKVLDLAQSAPGNLRLNAGGFAPGAGELNELWSDDSIRFDGAMKFGESRKNTQLAITYTIAANSQTALGYFQRKVNRFFLDAKRHALKREGSKVWLEYRWSDNLNTLPTPAFGQLSHYYQVYSAGVPKWPDNLHDQFDDMSQGYIFGIALNLTCSPAPEGLEQRAGNATGAVSLHDKGVLVASGSSSKLHYSSYTSSGLTGQFTITGWFTLNTTWSSGTKDIFDYYVSASNRIRIQYDVGNTRFVITKIVASSTFTANSSSFTIANGDDVHLQLIQNSTTLYLYANGTQIASVAATATMTDGGLIALGCPGTGTIDGVDIILDGWRILDEALSSTQASTLYTAELPIKNDDGQVGPPPYFWTKDGDGVLDNVDDTSRDNWGIIGGVSGDLEADTRIGVVWTSAYARDIWIGMKSQDSTFTPSSYLWNELTGLTNTSNSSFSGGSYTSGDFATQGAQLSAVKTGLTSTLLYGRYQVLAFVGSTNSTNVRYWWKFGAVSTNDATHNIGDDASYSIDLGLWQLLSLGDAFIESSRYTAPTGYEISAYLELVDDISDVISWTAGGDFIFLLPWPYARIVDTQSSWSGATDPYSLSIEGTRAYTTDTGADFAYIGDPIRPHPGKYNYLFLMQVENAFNEFQVTDTATVSVWVTPRFALPGGMVS